MRLKQIKLAGFKSFVDPTTVPFPDNLTAIVGPNGCGKSNLIDAVRWVMGESSAKHLRGDSMTDVIFNGSTSRKPVGQASIELVFDNTDGTLTGEYAGYAEIALRRMVTRDGQSSYFLNGTKCRRKDITDIFLGTGLGPRSYAIIEQGMISRLIESKPQELRVFLEEAAGISKYKERRRETENRIRHTRENMERLSDIREELGKQLAHLQRQSNAASKYKDLKQEERKLKGELSALKWRKFNQQVELLSGEINKLDTDLEARVAEQRHADAQIEKTREDHIELSDEFNAAQGKFYGIGADIARLEQGIAHKKERQSQLNQDFQQVSGSLAHMMDQMTQDEQNLEELRGRLVDLEPELEIQQQTMEDATDLLSDLESEILDWEKEWDSYNKISAENSQRMEVERTRIQHFDRVIERLGKRMETNELESNSLKSQPIEEDVLEASIELSKVEEETNVLSEAVEELFEEISSRRLQRRARQSEIDISRRDFQNAQGRHISLQALQQAALGNTDKGVEQWLNDTKLINNNKIAQDLKVESGWGTAVETVLGESLEAITVDNLDDISNTIADLDSGSLQLYSREENNSELANNSLYEKVSNGIAVKGILSSVIVVETREQAFAQRLSLKPHQSVISKDGYWIGRNWLRVAKKAADQVSVLERDLLEILI